MTPATSLLGAQPPATPADAAALRRSLHRPPVGRVVLPQQVLHQGQLACPGHQKAMQTPSPSPCTPPAPAPPAAGPGSARGCSQTTCLQPEPCGGRPWLVHQPSGQRNGTTAVCRTGMVPVRCSPRGGPHSSVQARASSTLEYRTRLPLLLHPPSLGPGFLGATSCPRRCRPCARHPSQAARRPSLQQVGTGTASASARPPSPHPSPPACRAARQPPQGGYADVGHPCRTACTTSPGLPHGAHSRRRAVSVPQSHCLAAR